MRFSQITEAYYSIRLSPDDRDRLDIHFSGAAHHRARAFAFPESLNFDFHFYFYYKHLFALMTIIFERGDFRNASDPCNEGMDGRGKWNPNRGCPDPTMFDQLGIHPAYGPLELTFWDDYLPNSEQERKTA